MNSATAPRRMTLCADDYGLSPGINRAILELIGLRRINAASVMTVAPAFDREQALSLQRAADQTGCQIGLHLTLTAPFRPLTMQVRPLHGNSFLPLSKLLIASLTRRLDRKILRAEIAAQLAAFKAAFGRAPDYADGHQHVQVFPQIREAFVDAVADGAPNAWVRQCGRAPGARRSVGDLKSLTLDILSAGLRRRAKRAGVSFNPAFAGAYDFSRQPDFAAAFEGFLEGLPDGGLVMCHPGFVDDTLIALDPLTTQRERERDFLAGDRLPELLAARNMALA